MNAGGNLTHDSETQPVSPESQVRKENYGSEVKFAWGIGLRWDHALPATCPLYVLAEHLALWIYHHL